MYTISGPAIGLNDSENIYIDFFSSITYLKALDASFKAIQLLPSDVFFIIPMEFESFPNGSDGESE